MCIIILASWSVWVGWMGRRCLSAVDGNLLRRAEFNLLRPWSTSAIGFLFLVIQNRMLFRTFSCYGHCICSCMHGLTQIFSLDERVLPFWVFSSQLHTMTQRLLLADKRSQMTFVWILSGQCHLTVFIRVPRRFADVCTISAIEGQISVWSSL